MTRNRGKVPTQMNIEYYTQRAGAGLIVTEGVFIEKIGSEWPDAPGIYTNEQIGAWKKVTESVHKEGGKIFCQLWHVGRVAHHVHNPGNSLPVGPSAIAARGGKIPVGDGTFVQYETPRALETDEVESKVLLYKLAAINAKEAGFDGVELHAAFGYLPNQFLLDGSNQRTDKYGGSLENRARFILEIMEELVKVWGADYVGIKLSPSNTYNDMSDSDPKATYTYLLERLNDLNLAYVCLMEGGPSDVKHGGVVIPCKEFRPVYKGNLFFNNEYIVKSATEAVRQGECDAVEFGRFFIANPDLVERVRLDKEVAHVTDYSTLYYGGPKGFIDYPTWEQAEAEKKDHK
eukprot:TRINITY_DN74623_c0_g1_i1.p1 TRINITY_DN74623_c0_g1~~TRINITY_DN74623_c0_g1_i1.p1  ORF type:complete len:374 (-),score=106.62 TRINITY_DN74623_c0_g1_i1:18-1055(-)